MLIAKGLGLFIVACIALAVIVIIAYTIGKWIRDEFITDRAAQRREIEELEELYNKIEKVANAN